MNSSTQFNTIASDIQMVLHFEYLRTVRTGVSTRRMVDLDMSVEEVQLGEFVVAFRARKRLAIWLVSDHWITFLALLLHRATASKSKIAVFVDSTVDLGCATKSHEETCDMQLNFSAFYCASSLRMISTAYHTD